MLVLHICENKWYVMVVALLQQVVQCLHDTLKGYSISCHLHIQQPMLSAQYGI